jgi:serine/threonine protein kinase/Tol biopolymer transport system component
MSDDPDRHRRVRALFERVREAPPDRRDAALDAACAGDLELHAEVASLLSAAARAESVLEQPAAAALAESQRLVGRRFGPHEVQSVLGVGGMGEVYRARDTRLQRDVALKVLPAPFAADPDRLARFDREARVLASLNHPQIGAIYGLEESDGIRALVLELVDGPTLADRIAEGPLPLGEALAIARQIGRALAAAHEQGIVHRDLKPGNVKLRTDGTVKVLDFGLAKSVGPLSPGTGASREQLPTATAITGLGLIVGTAAYMSPEQAKGRPADKRSDIWAFGCVLFEMLAGRRAFESADAAEALAVVLTKEPDWSRLPPRTPSSVRRLLRRCLEKDRERRLADIADAQLELDEHVPELGSTPDEDAQARPRPWLPWSVAAASLVIALGLAALLARDRRPLETAVYRSSILLPGRLGAPFDNRGPTLALSPDGRRLAFVATDATGRAQLWLRTLDSGAARPLADTAGAGTPFWSPDGRWLAFVAAGVLRKIDTSGGPVVTVCESAWAGGAWSRDDVILFTRRLPRLSLARVPAAGGTPSAATNLDFEAGEFGHLLPQFLPDGRRFLYTALSGTGQVLGLYRGSLDSDSRSRLAVDASFVQYAHGYLWLRRGSTLMAQRFDPDEHRTVGEAVPVAEQLRTSGGASFFSVSATGVLVFQADPSPGYELTWFDRTGRPTATLGTRDDYADLSLSPDGGRAVVSVGESGTTNRDLWIFDVARGVRTRLTSDPLPQTHSAWSPDGARIAYDVRSTGHFGLFQKPSNGAGDVEVLLADGFDDNPVAWSPDGRFILYVRRDGGTANLWVLPLEGQRQPFAFTHTQFNVPGQFSPDGRWVVYGSADSGRVEVYVAPFPGPGAKSLLSTGGGMDPRWRRDGKEILYLDPANRKLMSAAVVIQRDRVDIGRVEPLFDLRKVGPRVTYDLSPDGQRILAITRKDDGDSEPLTLVVNWPALLTK